MLVLIMSCRYLILFFHDKFLSLMLILIMNLCQRCWILLFYAGFDHEYLLFVADFDDEFLSLMLVL